MLNILRKGITVIRIVENNDWVIFTLLILGAIYLVMFYSLQRGLSLKEFLLQDYNEKQNSLLCWAIISIGFSIALSVLMAQYIPIVPRFMVEYNINGYVLNKIGMMITSFLVFYFVKSFITALFYKGIGQLEKYWVLGFIAQKFYFILSLLLILINLIHYYLPIDREKMYVFYILGFFLFFIGKNIFYFFHKEQPLPEEWYYKILYICTLQILPLLAIWKLIFL